jgi:Zn-dependent peptidase ImmA (M78 family)/DNA-binding XRE family transcriptional regulator
MMARTAQALVKPELLVWARESAGLSPDEAAKKADVSSERLKDWETGVARPSIAQLRALARAYHRPLAIFYLPKPPKKFKAMHDYRRLSGTAAAQTSYELGLEIRRARDRREIALELFAESDTQPPKFKLQLSIANEPEVAAATLRSYLGVSEDEQLSWRTQYAALDGWRDALESAGVLVFQASGIDIGEMRGFSFSESPLPTIVVNTADTPLGRVFSIAHETVHIALRHGGLCDMVDEGNRPPEEQRLEVFCNATAAAVLMPRDLILRDPDVRGSSGPAWTDDQIKAVARRFKVSREALVRRLLTLGRTTPEFYRKKREQFIDEYRRKREEQKGFAPPDAVALTRAGNLFTQLVLDSYRRELITSADVSEYLDVKLKHLQNIERAATIPAARR